MSRNVGLLFEASYLKVERARHHIAELTSLLTKHETENPATATFENNHLRVVSHAPPKIFGAIVGDAIHNLRAALDLMAVDLVREIGGNTKSVYFPFCESANDLSDAIKSKNFHRAGTDAANLLITFRPFKGGNLALRALHDLDIQDKHHTLVPNAAMMTTPEVTVDTSDFPNLSVKIVEGSQPDVRTVFPDDSPLAGQEIIPALYDLVQLVEGILEAFTSLVAPRP